MRRPRKRPAKESPVAAKRPKAAERTGAPAGVLVLCVGNPGRGDDGIGPAAAERLGARRLPGVTCEADYQLNVEDALACSQHDLVVFVDAARGLRAPFAWREVREEAALPAMTHSLGPSAVMALCSALYGRKPEARILAVRGQRWGVGEGLSPRAERNLAAALDSLEEFIGKARPSKGGPA